MTRANVITLEKYLATTYGVPEDVAKQSISVSQCKSVEIQLDKLGKTFKVSDLIKLLKQMTTDVDSVGASTVFKKGRTSLLHSVTVSRGLPPASIILSEQIVGTYTVSGVLLLKIENVYRGFIYRTTAFTDKTTWNYLDFVPLDPVENTVIGSGETILDKISKGWLEQQVKLEETIDKVATDSKRQCPYCREGHL